jgi:NAD(P) transhydrogenase subunit beta
MKGLIATAIVPALYLLSSVLFILGLKGLTRVRSARRGNRISAIAMLIAVVATLLHMGVVTYTWILLGLVIGSLIGAYAATKVEMTEMPEMVALFNGAGGASSALVALAVLWRHGIQPAGASTLEAALTGGTASAITTSLSVVIGSLTLSGSVVAYLKLRGTLRGSTMLPGRHVLNVLLIVAALGLGGWLAVVADSDSLLQAGALALTGISLLLGILLVVPIGGADMPVVISLLNSYSGIAASATGFVLGNNVLIISGALVGASGLILTNIMCVAMNRSLMNVLVGGFGETGDASSDSGEYTNVRSTSADEVAMMMEDASSVVVVPGYGLAVAQAQHAVREMAALLESKGADVKFAIHPVAGRMPGHMNVLLAEADVPYEQLVEMDEINPEFKNTDLVLIVGANDVVNPAALDKKDSPIYGMPILEVHHARMVIVVKRSLSPGYAGIKNELFDFDNTLMLFGDAKKAIAGIVSEIKENG